MNNPHNSTKVSARPYTVGAWLFLFLVATVLWQRATTVTIWAQGREETETIPGGTIPGDQVLFLPIVAREAAALTPTPLPTSTAVFELIPIVGAPTDRPAHSHPDLNLSVRGYEKTVGELGLITVNGDTDSNAPQFIGLFAPPRVPTFTALYQVYDWDWGCTPSGCRGALLAIPEATLLAVATTPGETIHIPTRNPDIYNGGYKAMVLYAENRRITLAYTRDDTAALGYLVHLEDILVDPALLSLYEQSNGAGRTHLPALRNGEPFATASGTSIKLAIRDTGTFMDPRSRKDWWMGFATQ